MASGIVFFNQLSGGAALGSFGRSTAFLAITDGSPQTILSIFCYLNILQVLVTWFSGQFL